MVTETLATGLEGSLAEKVTGAKRSGVRRAAERLADGESCKIQPRYLKVIGRSPRKH
jgi:hypothetical protein